MYRHHVSHVGIHDIVHVLPLFVNDNISFCLHVVQSISQVLTVERLLEHQSSGSGNQSMCEGPHNGAFSCILFVFLTSLEIDDSPSMAVCYRW